MVAAVIGWLRAQWDGYGRSLAGVLILCAPFLLAYAAARLRVKLPLSARLLQNLGAFLTAPALLSVDVFELLPLPVSSSTYQTAALLLSALALVAQAWMTQEKTSLYLGGLCAATAGWPSGLIPTAFFSLATGSLATWASISVRPLPDPNWQNHLTRIGIGAVGLGSFSALFLFSPEQNPWVPMVALSSVLILLQLPTILDPDGGAYPNLRFGLQAFSTVLGTILMRVALDFPTPAVGLYLVFAAALFLTAEPRSSLGLQTVRFGSLVGLAGLTIGFFTQLNQPVEPGLTHTLGQFARFSLAGIGAGLFGYLSRQEKFEAQQRYLFCSCLLALFGGWFHLFLAFCPRLDGRLFQESWQLLPLLGSLPLFCLLLLGFGRKLLSQPEQTLSQAFCLVTLFLTWMVTVNLAVTSGDPTKTWPILLLWIGGVSFWWERAWKGDCGPEQADKSLKVQQALVLLLPRLALWSLVIAIVTRFDPEPLGSAASNPILYLVLMTCALILTASAPASYRDAGFEMGWVLAIPTLIQVGAVLPEREALLLPLILTYGLSWAAPRRRPSSFTASALLSVLVLMVTEKSLSELAVLAIPVLFLVASLIPPPKDLAPTRDRFANGRVAWDLVLNSTLFLGIAWPKVGPLKFLGVGVCLGLAAAMLWAIREPKWQRAIPAHSPSVLLACCLFWTLSRSTAESGLLLVVAAAGLITIGQRLDLANGCAILGTTLLFSFDHLSWNLTVLSLSMLGSEIMAWATTRWRPLKSTNTLLVLVLLISFEPGAFNPEQLALVFLCAILSFGRGLTTEEVSLVGLGGLVFLSTADQQLSSQGIEALQFRLLPLASMFIATGVYLLRKAERNLENSLGLNGASFVRIGLGLLVLPALLSFAAGRDLMNNFLWVLSSGTLMVMLSMVARKANQELAQTLRQGGSWTLAGWCLVTLGRAATLLPWQAITLLVGLGLVAAGILVERKRKRST